ncbi:MAG: DUF4394 domain-containing protein [Rhodobacteraceae bacterium]|jgi:hypothetical protein|nr:DUF4394 domain-containing protein [Paracoccaceae bacterium]
MIRSHLPMAALCALAATPALAAGHGASPTITGYALADGGTTLVVMASIDDADRVETHALSAPLSAIAWRPVTGTLLGLGDGRIVEIDPSSGAITDLGAMVVGDATIADGAMVGLDFNNAIDAVRAVSTAGDNLVYFPDGFGENDERAGSLRRFTGLAYAEGDANAGSAPMVFANAYTNAITGMTAGSTAQFALDAGTDALVTLANNAGTLTTVGAITIDGMAVDLVALGGFDIVSVEEGSNQAYAILQRDGAETAGLYAIDLESGAATLMQALSMGGLTGFAAAPGM